MPYIDFSIYGADWALLLLRIAVAATFLSHGLAKRAMWSALPSASQPSSQLWLMRSLSIIEPLAGLAVLLGMFTFPSAIALAVVMLGALYYKIFTWKKKFAEAGGWEIDLLLLAALLLIAALGPGVFSLSLP